MLDNNIIMANLKLILLLYNLYYYSKIKIKQRFLIIYSNYFKFIKFFKNKLY